MRELFSIVQVGTTGWELILPIRKENTLVGG
jgi:hypothetical protein